jgi:hypothetical protein
MDLSHICKIKGNYPYFIQHQVSSTQYLAAYGANVNFKDFFIFGSPPWADLG